jgi:hypothetical protein
VEFFIDSYIPMDELMEDLPSFEERSQIKSAYFQFDGDDPIHFAHVLDGELVIRLIAEDVENPQITFSDGNGKQFSIFLKNDEL